MLDVEASFVRISLQVAQISTVVKGITMFGHWSEPESVDFPDDDFWDLELCDVDLREL
jgi:hypothetical protein